MIIQSKRNHLYFLSCFIVAALLLFVCVQLVQGRDEYQDMNRYYGAMYGDGVKLGIQSSPEETTAANYYVDGSHGSDSNPGTELQPWKTIQKAVTSVTTGDTIYIRGGEYPGVKNGWSFQNSGTQTQPITLTNYPGEQVVFKIVTSSYNDRQIFRCWVNPKDPPKLANAKSGSYSNYGFRCITTPLIQWC